jgi:hypothetical protein
MDCDHMSAVTTKNDEGETIEVCPECDYSAVQLPDGEWMDIT